MAKKMGNGTKVAIGVGVGGVAVYAVWRLWKKFGGGAQREQDAGKGDSTGPTQTWDPSTNWGTPQIPRTQDQAPFTATPNIPSREAGKNGGGGSLSDFKASGEYKTSTPTFGGDRNTSLPSQFTMGGWHFRKLTPSEVAQRQDWINEGLVKNVTGELPSTVEEAINKQFGAGQWQAYKHTDKNVYYFVYAGSWYRAAQ
jgi:hypothetical protein